MLVFTRFVGSCRFLIATETIWQQEKLTIFQNNVFQRDKQAKETDFKYLEK